MCRTIKLIKNCSKQGEKSIIKNLYLLLLLFREIIKASDALKKLHTLLLSTQHRCEGFSRNGDSVFQRSS